MKHRQKNRSQRRSEQRIRRWIVEQQRKQIPNFTPPEGTEIDLRVPKNGSLSSNFFAAACAPNSGQRSQENART